MSYKELFLYIVQIKKLVQSTAPVRTNRFRGNPSQITDRRLDRGRGITSLLPGRAQFIIIAFQLPRC